MKRVHERAPRLTRAQLWASLVVVAFLGAPVRSASQQPPAAPGAIVRGRLVAADTNLPFRDATVSLQPLSSQPPHAWARENGVDAAGRCGRRRRGAIRVPRRAGRIVSDCRNSRSDGHAIRSGLLSRGFDGRAPIVQGLCGAGAGRDRHSSSSGCHHQRTRRGRTRSAAVVRVGQRCENRSPVAVRACRWVSRLLSAHARTTTEAFGSSVSRPENTSSWRSHHP